MSDSDMDCSDDPIADYNEIAKEYRQANWSAPHNPFHACFMAADKKEVKHSYEKAFRSGPYRSLQIEIPKPKTEDKIIVKKSATVNLSAAERAKVLWESF